MSPMTRIEHWLDALNAGAVPDYPEGTLSREEHFLKAAVNSYRYLVEHKLDATYTEDHAPTTEDEGQIGQFWYDSSNSNLYVLTNYDPETGVYTWTEISTGGGGGGTSDYNKLSNKPKINSVELTGDKSSADLGLTTKVTLYSDGNAIYSDAEMTTTMTYAEIKALVDDTAKIVVVDNGNYELRYQYENAQGEENAIWFNANTMLSGKPYLYRIIINSNNQVLNDEIEVAKAIDGTLTGTTNAENIVVSGDLTCDGDTSIANGTVSGELDVPTPTADNQAANKSYVDTGLSAKADTATTYTKTEVDTSLALKADKSDTYTKTEVDTALSAKADQSTTYTKTEVDTALAAKQAKLTAGTNITISEDNVISAEGGGSGPTVVQTTGTSTTDVMSQNAVTTELEKRQSKITIIGTTLNI